MAAWMRLVPIFLLAIAWLPATAAEDAGGPSHGYARYEVVLQGAWAEAPHAEELSLEFTFSDPQWIRGNDGRWVATFPVTWTGPELRSDGWHVTEGMRYLDTDDGAWVALATQSTDRTTPTRESLFDVVHTWNGRSWAGAEATFLPAGSRDCFLAPPGGALRCQVPGVTAIHGEARVQRATLPGMATQVVSDDGMTRIDAWYQDDVPYAARVQVQDLHTPSSHMVLRLVEWTPWRPVETDAPDLLDLEPVRMGHEPYFIPSDAGVVHPFSLSQAIAAALAEPASGFVDDRSSTPPDARYELEDYLASRQAFVYHAEHMRYEDEPPDHAWLLGWTDGYSTLWLRVREDGDPPALVNGLLGADNRTFTYVDKPAGMDGYLPTILEARSTQPPVAELMRYWKAYAGAEGVQPDSWGLHVGCTGCEAGALRLWAGTASSSQTIEGPLTETYINTTVQTSYLFMDGRGRVLEYEERTEVDHSGEAYGPSTFDGAPGGIAGPRVGPAIDADRPVQVHEDASDPPGLAALPLAAFAVAAWVLRRARA